MSLLRRLCKLARVILIAYGCEASVISPVISQWRGILEKRLETRGLMDMIKFVKESRNAIMRNLSGSPLSSSADIKLNPQGWPTELAFLWEFYNGDVSKIRVLLTLLTLTRAFETRPVLDISTITDPWSHKDTITDFEMLVALRKLRVPSGSVPNWSFPHMSTKSGPIGQALMSSLSELALIPQNLLDNIKLIGGSALAKMMEENMEGLDVLEFISGKRDFSISHWWRLLFPTSKKTLRRLTYFGDKEGKTRVVAILDYWTQSALKPLHNHINLILKRIPMDCTFNQNSFKSSIPTDLEGNHHHSIDLTAATDRMPIALQKRVIAYLFKSDTKAIAWRDLLVREPFAVKGLNDPVTYGAGQPMGAYSSWPSMALTHHIIVQVAAFRALSDSSARPFTGYSLLGDDLRIDNDMVASAYKALISQLGMPYSEAKTHTSKTMFEFAKRWFHSGIEVTGFSISGLLSVWKSYPQLINFLENQEEHGWVLPISGHPDLILAIHKELHGDKFIYNKTKSMITLYMTFSQVRLFKSNQVQASELVKLFSEHLGLTLNEPNDELVMDTLNRMYIQSKRNLVEKDLLTFQRQAYQINSKMNKYVNDMIKKTGADQATQSFLYETLTVVLGWNNPTIMCLNSLIDKSMYFLEHYWDPDISSDFLFSQGLSKYNISTKIFSMRSSVSITLSESMILKEFIKVYDSYITDRSSLPNPPDTS